MNRKDVLHLRAHGMLCQERYLRHRAYAGATAAHAVVRNITVDRKSMWALPERVKE